MKTTISLLFSFLFLIGCSIKTIVHPYPEPIAGNIDEATDRLEIEWKSNLLYVNQNTGLRVPLFYSDGTLKIKKSFNSEPVWNKKDSFINPITKKHYIINAVAKYHEESNSDEFIINISENTPDSEIGFIEGLVEDATVHLSDRAFSFVAVEFWEPRIIKEKIANETVWHHYPYGGLWDFYINEELAGEIVLGSPVVRRLGGESHYGESYTMLFDYPVEDEIKAELINAFISYLALVDIEFYYFECDYENPGFDDSCPGSILIH